MPTKSCACCAKTLPQTEFYSDKSKPDGLYRRCKSCHCASTAKYAKAHREDSARRSAEWRARNTEQAKQVSKASNRQRYASDPAKARERSRLARTNDPARIRSNDAKARSKRVKEMADYCAAYYERNKEAIKAAVRERADRLREELKPANAAKAMRRVARKRQATPAWANHEAILTFYEIAARLTRETGRPHHVDHMVPLQSKRVSGLHVEHNLQVLLGPENQSKSNRWWPDQ